MKKKLLSLVLAGAMVASTSVSAFAADTVPTNNVEIGSGENDKEVEIGVEGNILNTDGNKVPGTINVTVPTATTFSVDATTGKLTSPKMTITNNGDEKIKVTASRFDDPNGDENISIVKKSIFEQAETDGNLNNRGVIWLRLKGGRQTLGLTSENNGKMYDVSYNTPQTADSNYEIGKIDPKGGVMTLELEGKGGVTPTDKYSADKAIQDNFTLVLKIARDN
ncbi:hypothetical protein [uncultured Clostridium sp.]|uniref:hypothetical protein n=1 Tax=uncultured Clostridium sp. TaxID=59620 RepID=UPI00266F23BD|nr:hypothetical protein [uncultured Clostridium sp.]